MLMLDEGELGRLAGRIRGLYRRLEEVEGQ
jgi:hypothetical protein